MIQIHYTGKKQLSGIKIWIKKTDAEKFDLLSKDGKVCCIIKEITRTGNELKITLEDIQNDEDLQVKKQINQIEIQEKEKAATIKKIEEAFLELVRDGELNMFNLEKKTGINYRTIGRLTGGLRELKKKLIKDKE